MFDLGAIIGHLGVLVPVVCAALAVVAIIYVPAPLRGYAISGLLLAAVASQIYAAGYHSAATEWRTKYNSMVAADTQARQSALIAAQAKAQADTAAAIALVRAQIDQVAAERDAEMAKNVQLLNRIARAGKAADKLAPSILRDAVHGR